MTPAGRDAPWIPGPAEPEHRPALLPAALAEVTADGIRFGCTLAEFSRLGPAQEAHVVPAGAPPCRAGWPCAAASASAPPAGTSAGTSAGPKA
jgi:hypothetical protein